MADDGRREDPVREIRLEGFTLLVSGGGLVALLALSFWLGRVVERRGAPATPSQAGAAREGPVTETLVDVAATQDFFDRTDRPGQALDPSREARRSSPSATSRPVPTPGAGAFLVQVWAGRDRPTGERLVSALQEAGFGVRMFAESSGGETLYKVRVGGYETETRARAAVDDLKTRGYRGAWVTATP